MSPQTAGHLAMLSFSALVAGSFSLGSLSANEISPVALNAVRFGVATLIIGAAAMATGGIPRGSFRAPWRYLLLGGMFSIYFVLMFEGLKTANPVSTSAVFTLTPAISALFGWLLLRQRMTPRIALALTIGAIGAIWVIFEANLPALLAFDIGRGEAIFFVGCVAHAVYTPMVPRLNRGERPLVFTFGMLVAGWMVLTIYGWSDLVATDWANLPPIVRITLAYIALLASSTTFVLLQFAALRLPSSKVMAYTYLTPSWVILWELALGAKAPPLLIVIGVAITILALLLLLRDEDRPARAQGTARTHPG